MASAEKVTQRALSEGSGPDDAEAFAELLPLKSQLAHFLAGHTRGQALLEALYDHVLGEEVPQRLTDMVRRRS